MSLLRDSGKPAGFKSKTSWKAKLEKPQEPEVVTVPENSPAAWGHGTMIIVTPKIIDDVVKAIPKGRLLTVTEMRKKFAADYGTNVTCPLTTGIFLRICAEAAEEARAEGSKNISPYWRVIRENGELIDKFPGGVAHQAELLQKEGFAVRPIGRTGKKLAVQDFEKYLHRL